MLQPATGSKGRKETAMNIDTTKLTEHIAMPDWERRLTPLFLFKGSRPNRIRTLWNVAYAMYLAEMPTYGTAVRDLSKTDDAHLCGLHAALQHQGLRGIFGRMRACKPLTDSVSKAFTEYVEWVHPSQCVYQPVPLVSRDPYRFGWWRKAPEKAKKKWRMPEARSHEVPYPFVRNAQTKEHELLMAVHKMIPRGVSHHIRGDLCQDMLVAVLSGELKLENVPDHIAAFRKQANKFNPERGGIVSIDAHICGLDDVTLLDRITDDHEHA